MRHLGPATLSPATRSRATTTLTFAAAALLATGCSSGGPTPPTLTISSAPLSLPGIGAACYDIAVTNAADGEGDVVWARGTPNHQTPVGDDVPESGDPEAICSGRFGNGGGGSVSYVGTCDAGPTGTRTNSVTLWIDGLYHGPDRGYAYIDPNGPNGPNGPDAWRDPCGTGGCTLNVTCRANQDVPVDFNLTLMRDAQQGFFDIAVGFEDVFCSAKADSCYDLTTPIRQLFGDDLSDPAGRDHTVVVGFACTAGPDRVDAQGALVDVATELILSAPSITCAGGVTFTLPLESALGGTRSSSRASSRARSTPVSPARSRSRPPPAAVTPASAQTSSATPRAAAPGSAWSARAGTSRSSGPRPRRGAPPPDTTSPSARASPPPCRATTGACRSAGTP